MNLIGNQYGRLTVISFLKKRTMPSGAVVPVWLCRCSCGKEKALVQGDLRKGDVNSCGCIILKHGFTSNNATIDQKIKHKSWTGIVERSLKRGYVTDLALDDLPPLTEICPVFNLPYRKGTKKDKSYSPSIDRKNPNLPYMKKYKDNLVFISYRANRLKSNATLEELKKIRDYLWSHSDSTILTDRLPPKHVSMILSGLKARAQHRGYQSDLEASDIPMIGRLCPVLGIEFEFNKGRRQYSPSLDRFNSNLPYLKKYKDNLRFISYRANEIKCNGTAEEFEQVIRYVESYLECKPSLIDSNPINHEGNEGQV
jgi:hypothetical protein